MKISIYQRKSENNRMKTYNRFTTIGMFLVLALPGRMFAQDDDKLSGNLEIIKNAKIELNTANRHFEKINNLQPVQEHRPVEYVVQDIELALPKLDNRVKVVTLKARELPKFYGNYVKAGFGNYTTPYLEAFINNKRSEKAAYGLHLKHFSSKNGPVRNSGFSENLAEVYGKHFGQNTILYGKGSYQRNRHNFYGYDQVLEPNAGGDSLKQVFSTIALTVGIENKNKNAKFNYHTDLSYYNFATYTKARESEFLWGLKSDYKLDADKLLLVDAGLSVSKRSDSSSIGRTLFSLKPALQYTFNDRLTLVGGVNVAYANDTIKDYNKFHLYPRLNVDYKLVDTRLIVFAGLDGDMQKNTLRTLSRENPFLASDVALFHNNKTLDIYGGIKGGLAGGVSYKIKFSTANYKYLHFMNNDWSDTSRFSVLYDNGNVNVTNIAGEVGYEASQRFRIALAAAYYNYTMNQLERPWHRPDFTGSVLMTYNLNQKVYFNADFYYLSGLTGKNELSGEIIKLKSIADLNLKIDYCFSNVFSAFIEANNLLSQKYQRYVYYPVKGINILAGLTYSF
jgi:hypothetical protein